MTSLYSLGRARLPLATGLIMIIFIAAGPAMAAPSSAATRVRANDVLPRPVTSDLMLQPWARIHVSLNRDWIQVYGFSPTSTVSATIYDQFGGMVLWAHSQPTDGNGYTPFWGVDIDVVPGRYVEVVDDATGESKSLIVADLMVATFDDVADTATGHAPADTQVGVSASSADHSQWRGVNAFSDSNGQWVADFAAIGWDVTPTSEIVARVQDGDGDFTEDALPVPSLGAALRDDWIDTVDFPEYAQVEIALYDGPGGNILFGPVTRPADRWGHVFIDRLQHGIDLVPGMVVTGVDTSTGRAKTLELANISWDAIDFNADTGSGTAPPGARLSMEVSAPGFWTSFPITADSNGQWNVDFGALGRDITPSMGLNAILTEPDRDRTTVQPPPFPTIQVGARHDWVNFRAFTPNGQVQITVRDEITGTVAYSDVVTMQANGELFYDVQFNFAAGQIVTATDLTTGVTKEHRVHPLTYDALNYAEDTASGTAAPNTSLWLSIGEPGWGQGFDVTADPSGNWFFDFGARGIDVTSNNWSGIEYYDEDRDATFVDSPPFPYIQAGILYNWINANNYTPGGQVKFEIRDPATDALLFGPEYGMADPGGNQHFELRPHNFDLKPDQKVIVTDMATGTAKEVITAPLTFDRIDYDADSGSGTAPAGATVTVAVGSPTFYWRSEVLAGLDGIWSVDFAAQGVDIQPDQWITAALADGDRDSTVVEAPPLPQFNARIEANLSFNWVSLNGFTPNGTVNYDIRDAYGNQLWSYDGAPIDGHGNGWLGSSVDLRAGMVVRATDVSTGTVKELMLRELDFDTYYVSTDIAAGTAEPLAVITVRVNPTWSSGFSVTTTADENGVWSVDLAAMGYDLSDYSWASAVVLDDDNDGTNAEAPWILAQPEADWLSINHFTPLADVAVSIYDAPGGNLLLAHTITANSTGVGWFSAADYGVNIVPGTYVVAHDNANGYEKALEVADVVFTFMDSDTDRTTGTAEPGRVVEVSAHTQFSNYWVTTTADSYGN